MALVAIVRVNNFVLRFTEEGMLKYTGKNFMDIADKDQLRDFMHGQQNVWLQITINFVF